LLEARAQFDAPERSVHVRLAEDAHRIYLDLADDHWRAVEIGREGWRLVRCPPVRFHRRAGLLPLPLPQRGGSLEQLACSLNLSSRNDFVLVVSWLLAALRPSGPYPVLAISGEQGSAKTVLSKMLRALIDPNAAPVRGLPRDERELFIAANNGHVLAFDNISRLRPWLSDALCRLASGGGFAVRRLYTDQDEVLFDAARPVVLNGIEEVITRPDLADRSIFLTLPPVADARRQPERELWRQFELARPRILGALFDLVAHGLRTLPDIGVDRLPRMADFALWAAACEPARFGVPAPSTAPMRQTAGLRLSAFWTPTRSPLACGRSWPSAAPGPGPPPTFCMLAPNAGLTGYRGKGPAGPKTPARSLAASAARRLSSGSWASTSRSVVGAATAAGSSGCVHTRKYRQHRQYRPRFRTRALNKPPPRWTSDVYEDDCPSN
jgi:hypothetical protein